MGLDYSTDWMGEHAHGQRIMGLGMGRRIGRRIAASMTASARGSGDEPAVRVAGERGLLSFWDAHRVWTSRNGVHSTDYFARSRLYQAMTDAMHEQLAWNEVHLEKSAGQRGWYATDLRRWEHKPVPVMDVQPDWEPGDDWLPIQEAWHVPEGSLLPALPTLPPTVAALVPVMNMRLSRLNYDKMHRCPTWSGGGWKPGPADGRCDASFASFMYEHGNWRWRFTRCRQCRVLCLPYVTRWLDPYWLHWRLSRRYRAIYRKNRRH